MRYRVELRGIEQLAVLDPELALVGFRRLGLAQVDDLVRHDADNSITAIRNRDAGEPTSGRFRTIERRLRQNLWGNSLGKGQC